MNIVFKNLYIESFMSISKADIDLENNGFVLIEGVNNCKNDCSESNGSGKSSIWEALVWCLTGDTIRRTSNIVNLFTDSGAFVSCAFSINDKNYQIIRSKNHEDLKTNLKFFIDDVDVSGKGIRETEKVIKQFLPDFDSLLIGSVIILGQGLPSRFSGNTPSGRKEILELLTKSDFMIFDLKSRICDRLDFLKSEKNETILSGSKEELKLKNNKDLISQLNSQFEFGNVEDYTKSLNNLNINLVNVQNEIANLKSDINSDDKSISELLSIKRDEQSEYFLNVEKLKDSFNSLILEKQKAISEISLQITNIEKEIKNLKNIVDVCPTCGQHIPNVIKFDTSDLEKDLAELQDKKEQESKELFNIKKSLEDKLIDVQDTYNSKIKGIDSTIFDIKNKKLDEILRDKEEDINRINEEIVKLNIKIDNINNKNKFLKSQIEELEKENVNISNNLELLNTKEQDLSLRLDIESKFQTLITRDFRGYLLKNIILFLNNKCKELSKFLFNNEVVSCFINKNNIEISLNDKTYEMLSGGEKQKVDIIIQFAIRELLCKYTGFSCSLIVLDEIFDNLDREGCTKTIDLINENLKDVQSVYIISHHADELQIPIDKKIKVVKNSKNVSEVFT